MIPAGVFVQQDGQVVPHLQIRQITPNAQGLVLLTEAEFEPFKAQKMTTKEGFAFLVMGPCSEQVSQSGKQIGFPAQVIQTNAPVLLQGILIQRGQKEVGRAKPASPMRIEQVETQTLKILLYRDQCEVPWEEVCERPIRHVLNVLPHLKTCKLANCTCENFHPSDQDPVEPLLDVWQRDFVTTFFKRSRPKEAHLFTCMLRVKNSEVTKVLQTSGTQGLYVEARTHDGRSQDPRYHTVWLQKHSFEQAQAAQASVQDQTCLIRVAHRYGLRTAAAQAPALHNQFKPDVPFLSGSALSTWVIGPLPWGTTRKALLSLFQTWEWQAKPLQPAGRSNQGEGLQWHIMAAGPPPMLVYSLSHGDVVITKHEPQVQMTQDQTTPPGRSQPLQGDPWAASAAKLVSPQITPLQMARIEEQVTNKIMKSLKTDQDDEPMDQTWEPRIAALEAQLQQVQQDQSQMAANTSTLQQRVDHLGSQLEVQTRKIQSHMHQTRSRHSFPNEQEQISDQAA